MYTQKYEELPKIVKIILQIFLGGLIGGIYRIIRFVETKNVVTLVVGILVLVTGIGPHNSAGGLTEPRFNSTRFKSKKHRVLPEKSQPRCFSIIKPRNFSAGATSVLVIRVIRAILRILLQKARTSKASRAMCAQSYPFCLIIHRYSC